MKLSTALSERSDIQNRISQLSVRLNNNAKVQDGDTPAEDPIKLIEELDKLFIKLEDLIARINMTNSTTVNDGKTISDMLAHRDCMKRKIEVMRNFLNNASDKVNRMTKSEIKIMSTVSVADIQKNVDDLSRHLRQTDEKIQELNWTTELL